MASGAFKIVGLLALVATATSASAATVYQHSGSGNFSYTSGSEYGDEILLQGWERVISGFSFEYAANYALSSGLTFRIYDQTGPAISGAASPERTRSQAPPSLSTVHSAFTARVNAGAEPAGDDENPPPDTLRERA